VAFYLYDLASEFHSWWNRGQDDPALRVIRDGHPQISLARLALARAVQVVISAGLGILGVTPTKEMK
jgi:arginyl-tRNA synthetase